MKKYIKGQIETGIPIKINKFYFSGIPLTLNVELEMEGFIITVKPGDNILLSSTINLEDREKIYQRLKKVIEKKVIENEFSDKA